MKITKLAKQFFYKYASMSKEEAAKLLQIDINSAKNDIIKQYDKLKEHADFDQEWELSQAIRVLLDITDPNLDDYGNEIKMEEDLEDSEFKELDSKLEQFQKDMFSMDHDAVKKLYDEINLDVKKYISS